jgi:hypothetical protein
VVQSTAESLNGSLALRDHFNSKPLMMADLRAIYKKVEIVCNGISRDLGTLLAAEQVYHLMSIVVFVAFITVDMNKTERLDLILTQQMYGITAWHVISLYGLLHHAEGLARQVEFF